MSVGDFQLHVACLGLSRHSGTNLKLRNFFFEKLRYFLCPLFFKVNLVSRLCCHVFGLILFLS